MDEMQKKIREMTLVLLYLTSWEEKWLAERFEVSTRTIYRDIEVLSSAGVPVYTNKGNSGGISLLEDYTLNKALLSKKESEGLLLAIKAMGATSYPEADAIFEKIGSIFKSNKAHDWIEVDFEGWSSKVNEQDRFSKIRDAIINKNVISFDIELGIPVSEAVPVSGEIYMSQTYEGNALVGTHKGAYKDLEKTYCALMDYAKENSIDIANDGYDYYLNNPADTPENELLTQVVFPIK